MGGERRLGCGCVRWVRGVTRAEEICECVIFQSWGVGGCDRSHTGWVLGVGLRRCFGVVVSLEGESIRGTEHFDRKVDVRRCCQCSSLGQLTVGEGGRGGDNTVQGGERFWVDFFI